VAELTDYNSGDVIDVNPHEDAEDPPDGPDWAYTAENKKFDDSGYENQPTEDEVFQPMAQQRLAEDFSDNMIKKTDYDEWDWQNDNKLKQGVRTDESSRPFPGANAQEQKFTAGQALHNPLTEEYKDQKPSSAKDLVSASIIRKFLKYS
jgi:hypothetical protein